MEVIDELRAGHRPEEGSPDVEVHITFHGGVEQVHLVIH